MTWTLFTDGASSIDGSGAGLILTDPAGQEITYALRFNFRTSNNEAGYEALIAGLQLAIQMETKHLHAYTDSLLIVNQVNGDYVAREEVMQKYLKKVTDLRKYFDTFTITQVPRSKNKRADALSKLASSSFGHLTKNVLVEVIPTRSIEVKLVNSTEKTNSWMDPIIDYLKNGNLPTDTNEARKIRIKAPQYSIKQDILYKKGYLTPWLRCVTSEEANYVLREAHFGSCGAHAGARSIAQKAARLGYFWPTMYRDATKIVDNCDNCQRHAPIIQAPGKVKFLVVAIDYFTKWAEAEPLATITGHKILKFVWHNIVCRYGIPGIIISDNGKQFANNPFREWCEELKIRQQFTSVAHPQANGQTEVTNRTILQGLKTRLNKAKGQWVEELPNVLWAYRTTAKTATGCTPFSLVYGSEAVLPPEIGLPTYRISHFEQTTNDSNLLLNLDLVEGRREMAAILNAKYKTQTERYYNSRVK
uniref:uncharacterized protein K02A2.6-like n=1 Tax=Erigeron canadensis TaxID=72917 RepID=UPI001CB9A0DD|nr:uncharacterized protein K02A2.6-like [Erigeron canadensis]